MYWYVSLEKYSLDANIGNPDTAIDCIFLVYRNQRKNTNPKQLMHIQAEV